MNIYGISWIKDTIRPFHEQFIYDLPDDSEGYVAFNIALFTKIVMGRTILLNFRDWHEIYNHNQE